MGKDKIVNVITGVLFLAGLGTIGGVFLKSFLLKKNLLEVGEMACVKETLQGKVRDHLMEPTFKKGEPIRAYINFYQCNPIRKNEIVYFRLGPRDPVPRRVRGLPGDHFEIPLNETGRYTIKVNGELILSGSAPFSFSWDKKGNPPLKTFEIARRGILGPNEYILLSDSPPGGSDSIEIGIVKKSAILGKVVR